MTVSAVPYPSIRIGVDVSRVSQFPQRTTFLRAVTVAQEFFTNLIQIKNAQSKAISSTNVKCGYYTLTTAQRTSGFSGVDVQIIIGSQVNNTQSSNITLTSGVCMWQSSSSGDSESSSASYPRPLLGYLSVTAKNDSSNQTEISNYSFIQLTKQLISEFAHILAFNINSFSFSTEPAIQDLHPFLPKLSTIPNGFNASLTLAAARQYFGCSTMTYIPIEVISSSGRFRWSRAILFDDLMSGGSSKGEDYWSLMNNALLEDTGWYMTTSLMYDSQMQWGQSRGCRFIKNGCSAASTQFPEFCKVKDSIGLNLAKNSLASCKLLYDETSLEDSSVKFSSKSCMTMQAVSSRHCWNENNSLDSNNVALVSSYQFSFSRGSRAYLSSLTPFAYEEEDSVVCLETSCSSDSKRVYINYGDVEIVCSTEGETVEPVIPFRFSGGITCPGNFTRFCETTAAAAVAAAAVATAAVNCEDNCSQQGYCLNGQCYCLSGRSGDGCQCSGGVSKVYSNGQCMECGKNCSSCLKSKCLACVSQYYLTVSGGCEKCLDRCEKCSSRTTCGSCKTGYFFEVSSGICKECTNNCAVCNAANSCVACVEGFGLDDSGQLCSLVCDYNCRSCSTSSTHCTACYSPTELIGTGSSKCGCPVKYFEDGQRKCQKCADQFCQVCSELNSCELCQAGYVLLTYNKICRLGASNLQPLSIAAIVFIYLIFTHFF